MGVFDLFRSAGKAPSTQTRTCVIDAPRAQVYAELAKALAASAALDPEAQQRIKSMLSPFAKMGVNVSDLLKNIKIDVDSSAQPARLSVATSMNGQAVGPATAVQLDELSPTSTRVVVTAEVQVGGSITDKLLMAGAKKKMEEGFDESVDTMLTTTATNLNAPIRFE
ncbi:hypothetical protein BH11PLA1_BH11PLA1_14830 [soil metagenome]